MLLTKKKKRNIHLTVLRWIKSRGIQQWGGCRRERLDTTKDVVVNALGGPGGWLGVAAGRGWRESQGPHGGEEW